MKQQPSTSTIVRRLRQKVPRITALYQEVDELYRQISAPTPEEYRDIESGRSPLTLEVLLIGVLGQAMYNLSEANVTIDYYRPYTEKGLGTGTQWRWKEQLGNRIEREVAWRARRAKAASEEKAG